MSEGPIIHVTVGLPGSGKTTWAEQYIKEHPSTVRINKDLLRLMFHAGEYSREKEDFVCTIRDYLIVAALVRGYNLVIDDTNLNPKHITAIQCTAAIHNAMVQIQDFTDVPLEICKERNRSRKDKQPIPDEAIMRMYNDHFEEGRWKYAITG